MGCKISAAAWLRRYAQNERFQRAWLAREHMPFGAREQRCREVQRSSQAINFSMDPGHAQTVTNQLLMYSPSLANGGLVGRYEPGQVGPANQSDPMFLFFFDQNIPLLKLRKQYQTLCFSVTLNSSTTSVLQKRANLTGLQVGEGGENRTDHHHKSA